MSATEIRAEVLPWIQPPAINGPFAAAALLVCNSGIGSNRLYVNTGVDYDHSSLAPAVNALIDAFMNGDIDKDWQDCGDGTFARYLSVGRSLEAS